MEELKEQGYRVVVSDLYAMNFRANATQDDIIGDLTVDDCVIQRSKYVFRVKSETQNCLLLTFTLLEGQALFFRHLKQRRTYQTLFLCFQVKFPQKYNKKKTENLDYHQFPLKSWPSVSCSGDLKNPELFQYGEETMHAWMEGRLSDDIVAEQRKVLEAELIIFQVRGRSCR